VKEVDYTLRTLARVLLDQQQMEMPPSQIPVCYQSAEVRLAGVGRGGVHGGLCV